MPALPKRWYWGRAEAVSSYLGEPDGLPPRALGLYPAWRADAHAALDAAVAAAYGWADWAADMPDDEILRRLLAPNRARAAAQ